jgi:hypothetical protein
LRQLRLRSPRLRPPLRSKRVAVEVVAVVAVTAKVVAVVVAAMVVVVAAKKKMMVSSKSWSTSIASPRR